MSNVVTIRASARDRAGKGAARATRREGRVPGVIYGEKQPPVLISVDPRELTTYISKSGFFARLVNEAFTRRAGAEASVKVTAPIDLVRNRKALPDAFEESVIRDKFLAPGWQRGQPYEAVVEGPRGPEFRMQVPEYYTASCLTCHGSPKGSLDITGYPREGGSAGDLGGVISITVAR